jgi:hypothetical protein
MLEGGQRVQRAGKRSRKHEDSEVLPCLSSHCGRRRLILLVGMRDPPRQRWVLALTMATLIRALLTHPQTWEQGFSHFSASRAESFFNKVLASLLRRPSADTKKGEKCRRCSRRQGPRHFFFFSRSWAVDALLGALEQFDSASASVPRTSMTQSVAGAQSPRIRMSPRSSLRLLQNRRCTGVSLVTSSFSVPGCDSG